MAQTEAVTVRKQIVVNAPIETDPAQTSEVEVRFYAESPTRTRVELEHRHIDRHGPGWEAVAGGVDGAEGWPLYLDRYAALLKEDR